SGPGVGVPQEAPGPARGVRRPSGARASGPRVRRTDVDRVPHLRGSQRRPRLLRVRAPSPRVRALHHVEGRAREAVPPPRPARVLRGRGLSRVLVEPPRPRVPARARTPHLSSPAIRDRMVGARAARLNTLDALRVALLAAAFVLAVTSRGDIVV